MSTLGELLEQIQGDEGGRTLGEIAQESLKTKGRTLGEIAVDAMGIKLPKGTSIDPLGRFEEAKLPTIYPEQKVMAAELRADISPRVKIPPPEGSLSIPPPEETTFGRHFIGMQTERKQLPAERIEPDRTPPWLRFVENFVPFSRVLNREVELQSPETMIEMVNWAALSTPQMISMVAPIKNIMKRGFLSGVEKAAPIIRDIVVPWEKALPIEMFEKAAGLVEKAAPSIEKFGIEHGPSAASIEELSRPGTNYSVSKLGVSYLGKQIDLPPQADDVIGVMPDGTLKVRATKPGLSFEKAEQMYGEKVEKAVGGMKPADALKKYPTEISRELERLTAFHGTGVPIEGEFKEGSFFTPTRKVGQAYAKERGTLEGNAPNNVRVELDFKNPKRIPPTKTMTSNNELIAQAKVEGYDSLIFTDQLGRDLEYVNFRPDQVKIISQAPRLSETEKFGARALPPRSSSKYLNKDDYDLLNAELPKGGLGERGSISAKPIMANKYRSRIESTGETTTPNIDSILNKLEPDKSNVDNVILYHATRKPGLIIREGIKPSVAGVIKKDPEGAKVFLSRSKLGSIQAEAYEAELRERVLGPKGKGGGDLFITKVSVPIDDIKINNNGDITLRRVVSPSEIVDLTTKGGKNYYTNPLFSEKGFIDIAGIREDLPKAWLGLRSWLDSPYVVLAKEPTGNGLRIWRGVDQGIRDTMMFMDRQFKAVDKISEGLDNVKMGRFFKDAEDAGWNTWEEIPAYVQAQLSPKEKAAFIMARKNYNETWAYAMKEGKVPPGLKKISGYMPHFMDQEDLFTMWKEELAQLEKLKHVRGLGFDETAKMKARVEELQNAINKYNARDQVILYDVIPTNFYAPFLLERKGAEHFSEDWVKSYKMYMTLFAKKFLMEPKVKEAVSLLNEVNPQFREYARWFLRDRALGRAESSTNRSLKNFEHLATSLTYMDIIGLNPRLAFQNLTQNINTITEVGMKNWVKAIKHAFSPEGEALWAKLGHAVEIPGLTFQQASQLKGVQDWAAYFYKKAELVNRKIAVSSGYIQGVEKGLKGEALSNHIDDVLRNTQFLYGRTGAPRMVDIPGMSIMTQFGTFSIKQLEFIEHMFKTNPKRALWYILLSNAIIPYGAEKTLGVDLYGMLSLGVDFKDLTQAAADLYGGRTEPAKAHIQLATPEMVYIPFVGWGKSPQNGILPNSFAPFINQVIHAGRGEWDRVFPTALQRVYSSVGAFREGKKEFHIEGFDKSGNPQVITKKAYPIRSGTPLELLGIGKKEKELLYVETPYELVMRTVIARPMSESIEMKNRVMSSVVDKQRSDVRKDFVENVAALIIQGKKEEADRAFSKYTQIQKQIVVDGMDTMIEEALNRHTKTPGARLALKQWRNKALWGYKKSSGFMDSTPIIP